MSKETFLHSTTMLRKKSRTIKGEPSVTYCYLLKKQETPVVVMIDKFVLSKEKSVSYFKLIRKFRGRYLLKQSYGIKLETFDAISKYVKTVNINEMVKF